MGFLGIGGSDRKTAALKTASDASALRSSINALHPDIADYRNRLQGQQGTIENTRQATGADYRGFRNNLADATGAGMTRYSSVINPYLNIINDPSKRGYSDTTKGAMLGKQMDVASGARTGYQSDLRRQIAAQGMNNTGAGLRNQRLYDVEAAKAGRGAARDIDIESEKLAHSDLYNALQGATGAINSQGDYERGMYGLTGSALEGETAANRGFFGDEAALTGQQGQSFQTDISGYNAANQTFEPELAAQAAAYKPGFWGKLGGSFAQGLGQAGASVLTGGLTGMGTSLGKWGAGKFGGGFGTGTRPTLSGSATA